MKKKIQIISILCITIILIIGTIFFIKAKKVESIFIDINNTKSHNLKISMAPSYKTYIYANEDSIINLNVTITPESKFNKKVEWIISDECAKIDEDNYITASKGCKFTIYARKNDISSNELAFQILE